MRSVTIFAAALPLALACTTGAPPPPQTPNTGPEVDSMELSNSVGEVGQRFESSIEIHSRRMGEAEYRVSPSPGRVGV